MPGALVPLIARATILADALSTLGSNGSTVAVLAILAVAGVAANRSTRHHAWILGALLPIDTIAHVSPLWLDAARYIGMAWLAVRVRPDISPAVAARVARLAGLLLALGVWIGVIALWRDDAAARTVASVTVVATPFAFLLARRAVFHLTVFTGYLAGVSLSAAVVLTQSLGLDAIRPAGSSGRRNPGLAGSTALTTWQMAFGLLIAVFLMLNPDTRKPVRILATIAALLCGAGLLACGAQGGLMGLAAAGLATALRPPEELRTRLRHSRTPIVVGVVAATVLGIGLLANSPTLAGLLGEGNFVNETARLDLNGAAWREFIANPVAGIGTDRFIEIRGLMPHFLPLDAAVASGVVGFVLALAAGMYAAVLVLRARPPEPNIVTWFGLAMGSALLANSLVERDAALIGFSRLPLLVMALVAVQGEPWAKSDESEGSEVGQSAPVDHAP